MAKFLTSLGCVLCVLAAGIPASTWAMPSSQGALHGNKGPQSVPLSQRAMSMGKSSVQGREGALRRVAQEKGSSQSLHGSNKPVPAAAWVIEGVGAVAFALGFVGLAIGYGNIVRRDQLVEEAVNGYGGLATEIKALEDSGVILATLGWIVGGVGVVMMAVGAIWIVSHKVRAQPKIEAAGRASSAKPMAAGRASPQGAKVLWQAGF